MVRVAPGRNPSQRKHASGCGRQETDGGHVVTAIQIMDPIGPPISPPVLPPRDRR